MSIINFKRIAKSFKKSLEIGIKFLPLRSANGEDREVGTDEENFFKKVEKKFGG